MKLFVLLGVIIAGMSSCGAARIADHTVQAVGCSHAAVHRLAV